MPVKITYFGHGTTEDNMRNIASGHADVPLSESGIREARKIGERYRGSFDTVFTSDLKRAADTAKLAFPDCRIVQDKRLRECDYGKLTRKPKTWQLDRFIHTPYPGGESYKDVQKRIESFLEFLRQNHEGEHIAIVSHHAPQLALDVLLENKTWKQAIDEDRSKKEEYEPVWEYVLE
ncbi:MAG: histidine phosphatase family protein [Candidatus Aenigmatarchaeota archaeon]